MFLIIFLATMAAGLFVWTRWSALQIEQKYPPIGQFAGSPGERLHYVDVAAPNSERPPVVFIHGASGNLRDQIGAFKAPLEGEARLIFVDRPGHGYSDRAGADDPAKQAERYKLLLDELAIEQAVLVGHSLGAASVAAFAVLYPERVKGLVFLAPATHPWPGGVTWYQDVASLPVIGHLFTEVLSLPVGLASLESGSKSVFKPNPVPDGYVESAAIALFLRPWIFRNNARDVAGLKEFVLAFSPRYKEIKAPTVVITGNRDDVVLPSIHSVGLERDIEGAELIVLDDVGHKPDYVANEVALTAIRKVSQ